MTPLADAMFQLLIFFMLSSTLTPYSLLTLQTASLPDAADSASASQGPAAGSTNAPSEVVIWRLERNGIRAAGQQIGFDQLGALADALGAADRPAHVLLIVLPDARVQDVSTALSHLRRANVDAVQVSAGEN
ncbi:MAG: ExbD/TolR family protein [Paracoccaceae bacterium]